MANIARSSTSTYDSILPISQTPTLVSAPSKPPQEPFQANFTDATPQMAAARRTYLKFVAIGGLSLVIIIFAMLGIYWGALWKVPAYYPHGWIVDFDGGLVGQAVTEGLKAAEPFGRISWTVAPSSRFPGGSKQVADEVVDEKVWVAAVINSNASSNLNTAISSMDASYNSTFAVTVYAIEGRNENVFRSIIRPTIQSSFATIAFESANRIAQQISMSANITKMVNTAPQLITQPIYYSLVNLRPFDIPVASAVTLVGLIYLLILSFFIVTMGIPARQMSGLERSLTTASLIRVRFATSTTMYFILSLCYSLLSLAFQVDFSRHYGKAGFIIFWMIHFIGMLGLGLALEAMVTLISLRFMPWFTVLFVIANTAVCFFPPEVLPGIYHYGYCAPFFAISRAVRTILFGTKDTLGLSFGILSTWAAISIITLPLFQWLMRRKEVNRVKKMQKAEKESP